MIFRSQTFRDNTFLTNAQKSDGFSAGLFFKKVEKPLETCVSSGFTMVAEEGFEPSQTESESISYTHLCVLNMCIYIKLLYNQNNFIHLTIMLTLNVISDKLQLYYYAAAIWRSESLMRAAAISKYFCSSSMPMKFRPVRTHATPVEPLPMQLSSTVSPGAV